MSIYNKSYYLFLAEKVETLYEKSRDDNLKDFPLSEREKFYKNGNRQDFEKLYFKRRDYLSSTAILALFDDSYIDELEKIIFAVCDECSWMLPAHIIHGDRFLDLFVAETSFALAEICTVFKDKISSEVYVRVRNEIKERLLDNYMNDNYWWESCNMNWASVCAGYSGGALIYMFPDKFSELKERILNTLGCYIDGFTDDGFCLEGPSYWQYGFMAYSVFADLLYRFSDGKEDLFANEKIKKTASYGCNSILSAGDTAISFSDGNMHFTPDYALQSYLHQKLPYTVPCPDIRKNSLQNSNTKWIDLYRVIIWQVSESTIQPDKMKVIYSSAANQLIVNNPKYSFALKGGNNGEPHNHNDLGSFIYSDKNGQVFCDLGSGRYTKDYFDEKKRYGIFCNSSFSHSVPIINGKAQSHGKEFTAALTYENNTALCDITKAYSKECLTSALRRFEIKERGVIITDKFSLNDKISVTERFVSLRKAEIEKDCLLFGETKLKYLPEKATLCVKEEYHTPHEYDAKDITVYCYDFLLKEGINDIIFEIITE